MPTIFLGIFLFILNRCLNSIEIVLKLQSKK
jgi:hypothetical protein